MKSHPHLFIPAEMFSLHEVLTRDATEYKIAVIICSNLQMTSLCCFFVCFIYVKGMSGIGTVSIEDETLLFMLLISMPLCTALDGNIMSFVEPKCLCSTFVHRIAHGIE